MLQKELEANYQYISQTLEQGVEPGYILVLGLQDQLWQAFSDSGEIESIHDMLVLSVLANAYYHIQGMMTLERSYWDPGFQARVIRNTPDGAHETYAGERTVHALHGIRPGSLAAIEQALDKIKTHITV